MIEFEEIKDAWDRIARTPEGLIIYRHLQRIRMGLAPENVPDSALPRLEGRRSLAADLMAYMAEAIAANDRACITFAIAKPAAYAERPAARRVTLDDNERVGNTELDRSLAAALAGTTSSGNGSAGGAT